MEYLKDVRPNTDAVDPECGTRGCAQYSGINYVLLGYVLTKLQGKHTWKDLDQSKVFPNNLKGRYKHTSFSKGGACNKINKKIAHQFSPSMNGGNPQFEDMYSKSCLNGWSMGNIVTTAADLATFFYDLFTLAPSGKGFVKAKTLKQMTSFKPMVDDWCNTRDGEGTCQYGLGLNNEQAFWENPGPGPDGGANDFQFIGHGGMNWGSGATPCGYHKKYKFGFCLAFTSTDGQNCKLGEENGQANAEAGCRVYSVVQEAMGGKKLPCKVPKLSGGSRRSCLWKA